MSQQQVGLQQNTENKQEKIMNLEMLIRELDLITTIKKNAFLSLIEQLRHFPNQDSYIKLKNLLQSLQPVLCTVASKVALFEQDSVATNNPEMPLLASIKNQTLNELEESTKLQIEEIDRRGIECKYETYNRELAKEMCTINKSVDNCIGYLIDKFQTYGKDKEIPQGNGTKKQGN